MHGPRLGEGMFKCSGAGDWHAFFEKWLVVYFWGSTVLALTTAIGGTLVSVAHFALIQVAWIAVGFFINLCIFLALSHISWFCVVKKQGCCGNIGYLIWGVVLVLLVLLSAESGYQAYGSLISLIQLLLLVPCGFMAVACLQLFRESGGARELTAAVMPAPA